MKFLKKYSAIVVISLILGFIVGQLTEKLTTRSSEKNKADLTQADLENIEDSKAPNSKKDTKLRKELFYEFAVDFFNDSAFQTSRIIFPLATTTPINHYDEDTTSLTIDTWRFRKHESILIIHDDYECANCDCDSDNAMITESTFGNTIFYDFQRIADKWYLVKIHEDAELGYQKLR